MRGEGVSDPAPPANWASRGHSSQCSANDAVFLPRFLLGREFSRKWIGGRNRRKGSIHACEFEFLKQIGLGPYFLKAEPFIATRTSLTSLLEKARIDLGSYWILTGGSRLVLDPYWRPGPVAASVRDVMLVLLFVDENKWFGGKDILGHETRRYFFCTCWATACGPLLGAALVGGSARIWDLISSED